MSDMALEHAPVIEARKLHKHYSVQRSLLGGRQTVHAVDGIDLAVSPQRTLAIVGESGCGKTTTSKVLLGIEEPTAGQVLFHGQDIDGLSGDGWLAFRRGVQAVFQDPWSSLNPRRRVAEIIGEPMLVVDRLRGAQLTDRVHELMESVGLNPSLSRSFPHEFSGGMRQRVAVARALALHPQIVILDEPVSALDVSVRAQVMNLLKDLQAQFGIAYVLISHDLATVRFLSDSVAVMYLGKVMEHGSARKVFSAPAHPYTKALVSAAIPEEPGAARERIVLEGDVPSPTRPPPGCRFHTRCWLYQRLRQPEQCRSTPPPLDPIANDHRAACHFSDHALASVDLGMRAR